MISIVVARGLNNVIGRDNQLIWRQSADLKRFKEITIGGTVVMGRKTFESIGKALPGRKNIVISRDFYHPDVEVIGSIEEIPNDAFIIGGGEIFRKSLILADRLYVTVIKANLEGDTFFPEIGNEWVVSFEESHTKDGKNEFDYVFLTLDRKK